MFLETLFLLAFIPLYPKIPLVDIKNTWVYVRVEDFIVGVVLLSWFWLLVKGKVNLKTPLTIPIFIFWIIGAIATIHGVVLIFPTLANVFPNVALLAYLRHIEYLSLFFIAYEGMREKKSLHIVAGVVIATLLGVIAYGFGQKYLNFPAYLTMNEEFAKGVAIQLSQLSRLPSTFAGHYDLAAYLVLIVPIAASLIFGIKNWVIKIFLAGTVLLGFVIMFMTVSRVSFVVLILALGLVVFIQRRKWVLYSIPILFVLAALFLTKQSSLFERFDKTVSEVNVLVDAKTGDAVGHVNFIPSSFFDDKIVLQRRVKDANDLSMALSGQKDPDATDSAIFPKKLLPPQVPLVEAINVSNGENLPQGTGYVNLSLSPVTNRLGSFFYELPPNIASTTSAQVLYIQGDFIVKRVSAYDLSFTTRFQGEWPHALEAFERNILFGSGYGSVSLAVDNNYLRMLGEIGLAGVAAFFSLFIIVGIFIKKTWEDIDSPLARSFVVGYVAGLVGLALNATLIDVFEASKIAFVLWLLTGVVLGMLNLYKTKKIDAYREFINAVTSPAAIVVYLGLLTIIIFAPLIGNFFIGDDFTWFRWAADCTTSICGSPVARIVHYFTSSDGFFYRPGTKIYFQLMYPFFWLNQVVYHVVSIFLHFVMAVLFYLLARKILKSNLLASISAFLFLTMSGYVEIVFWISSTGHLFNAVFALSALLFYIYWKESKAIWKYILVITFTSLSLLFHELGVVIPIILIGYDVIFSNTKVRKSLVDIYNIFLFSPVAIYLAARFIAQSHWQGGDYSYNLLKLPFNFVGNLFGYLLITVFGPIILPFYEKLRDMMKVNLPFAAITVIIFATAMWFVYNKWIKLIPPADKKIVYFSALLFVVALLPFIGLGNITSRYSYLASLGVIMILVFMASKLYQVLVKSGREIAICVLSLAALVFVLFHVIEVQQIHGDYRTAGGAVEKFFIGIDNAYDDYWRTTPVKLHFVNTPVKTGEAWIFPVGLNDAVWFAFKSPKVQIYQDATVEDAIGNEGITITNKVFKFEDDGTLNEVITDPRMVSPTPAP